MAPAKRQRTSTSSPTAPGNATSDARDPQPARADRDLSDSDADLVVEPEMLLLCPITRTMFRDPVVVVDSGHTYERSAVLSHFDRNGAKDPLTGRALSSTKVTTNRTVRQFVQAWLDEHPGVMPDGWDSRELLEPSKDDGTPTFDDEGDVGVLRTWRAMCPELREMWPVNEQPEHWKGVTMKNGRVVELELGEFGLTGAVPAEVGRLSALRKLSLSRNRLTSLPAEIGQLTSLRELRLSDNQLTSVPAEIGQLRALKLLILLGNQLTSVPAEIGQLASLVGLHLRDNRLTGVPAEIGQLTSLEWLYLAENQLTSLPAEIGQLTSLVESLLGGNQLTSVPAEIGQLTSLTHLDLVDNQLTSVPASIHELKASGCRVDLDDGVWTSVPAEVGQHWPGDRPGTPARGPRPPREKGGRGGGARATAAVGSTDKNARAVHQISLLTRGEDGKVVLPVGPIHGVTLESLGAVQPPDAPGFHSAAYILPVGYRTTRQYMRCDDPNGPRTRWVQEIVRGEGDDEGKPLFRLTADEGLDEPIVAKSATAAWAEVLRRVTTVRMANGEEAKKTAISGPEFFGYSLPHIRLLIEELPGVNDCTKYKPLLERSVTADGWDSRELLKPSKDDGTRLLDGESDVEVLRTWRAMCPELQEMWPEAAQPEHWEGVAMENSRVMELDLEGFGLTGAVPAEVGRLTALRELNVSRNALTLLPAEIGRLTSLKGLYLDENELTSVPAEIGQLTSLQELWLNDNQLTSLPAEIGLLIWLHILRLGGNQLTSMPAAIRKLKAAGCHVDMDKGVTVDE